MKLDLARDTHVISDIGMPNQSNYKLQLKGVVYNADGIYYHVTCVFTSLTSNLSRDQDCFRRKSSGKHFTLCDVWRFGTSVKIHLISFSCPQGLFTGFKKTWASDLVGAIPSICNLPNLFVYKIPYRVLYTRYPIVARRAWPACL